MIFDLLLRTDALEWFGLHEWMQRASCLKVPDVLPQLRDPVSTGGENAMILGQFTNSLGIIRRSAHTNRGLALLRHLGWQCRKLLRPRPIHRRLSRSVIVDDEGGGVISMVNMLGRYDFNNMHFVQTVLTCDPTPVFVDVGANIGAYTLIASEVPAAVVVSLEPIPATFAKLLNNIAVNRRPNVHALNVAASGRPGRLQMTSSTDSATNHVVPTDGPDAATVSVKVDTLDKICSRLGVMPSLIKIDVEGHEPEVLAGAVACLAACQAYLIENGDRAAIVSFMRKQGMTGPLYYHHDKAALLGDPQRLAEDHIYINRNFVAKTPTIQVTPPIQVRVPARV